MPTRYDTCRHCGDTRGSHGDNHVFEPSTHRTSSVARASCAEHAPLHSTRCTLCLQSEIWRLRGIIDEAYEAIVAFRDAAVAQAEAKDKLEYLARCREEGFRP